jgi:DNA-binding response OmpR family regulator
MAQKTVLIVDDEPDILELLAYNLHKEGFEVVKASNGQEAVTKALERLPDAIVLDIMMPEMDGFEACKAIRANAATSAIPVIFLTAKSGEIDEILGLELGADDYIQKPISPRLLVSRIKARIRRPAESVRTETIAAPELLKIAALEINLRKKNLNSWHFSPQILIKSLIVSFCCAEFGAKVCKLSNARWTCISRKSAKNLANIIHQSKR